MDSKRGRFAPMRRHGGLHDTEPSLLKIPFMKFCRYAPTFSGQVNRPTADPEKDRHNFSRADYVYFVPVRTCICPGYALPFPEMWRVVPDTFQ